MCTLILNHWIMMNLFLDCRLILQCSHADKFRRPSLSGGPLVYNRPCPGSLCWQLNILNISLLRLTPPGDNDGNNDDDNEDKDTNTTSDNSHDIEVTFWLAACFSCNGEIISSKPQNSNSLKTLNHKNAWTVDETTICQLGNIHDIWAIFLGMAPQKGKNLTVLVSKALKIQKYCGLVKECHRYGYWAMVVV